MQLFQTKPRAIGRQMLGMQLRIRRAAAATSRGGASSFLLSTEDGAPNSMSRKASRWSCVARTDKATIPPGLLRTALRSPPKATPSRIAPFIHIYHVPSSPSQRRQARRCGAGGALRRRRERAEQQRRGGRGQRAGRRRRRHHGGWRRRGRRVGAGATGMAGVAAATGGTAAAGGAAAAGR